MKKILPTPYKFKSNTKKAALVSFSKIELDFEPDETVRIALDMLLEKFEVGISGAPILTFSHSDDKHFSEKNAAEQGYILTRVENSVNLYAQSSVGFLYGVTTLTQLFGDAPSEFEIYDRPAVRLRGNMNTLWAESGVFSYDFGDGIEGAERRLCRAIDDMVRAKLNLMYIDAFGFRSERYPGYNAFMTRVSEYAKIRGMRTMCGGYGMGYGQSASCHFMGRVFRNRYPYPDGEIYDCLGSCERDMPNMPVEEMLGRSYGTCITNDELTDDKISEMKEYLKNTGISVIYFHNMDADEIQEPLWLGRCKGCRSKFPNDSLYTEDGAAGAFARFFDRILDSLLPDCPDLVLCGVSPGYLYHIHTKDHNFEKSRKFWNAVIRFMKNKSAFLPTFRELFVQKTEPKYRFDLLDEVLDSYACVYFSSGDGFYSDKCYTPSGAYAAAMKNCELVICANGSALQKPTQYANAEYLWNPTASAFYNVPLPTDYDEFTKQYDELREGIYRPEGIYGEGGLLDTSCELLFGEKCGKLVADVFRLRGRNNECPIFTLSNVEIFTNQNQYNLKFCWDRPVSPEEQEALRTRFAESALLTVNAEAMLADILTDDSLTAPAREHLEFLRFSARLCGKFCMLLTRYMDLYIEADRHFAGIAEYNPDIVTRLNTVAREADAEREKLTALNRKPFDVYNGIFTRDDELFESISYNAGQILKSLKTGKRVPDDARPPRKRAWW